MRVALSISGAVSVAIFGISWLHGTRFVDAATLGATWFLILFAIQTPLYLWLSGEAWRWKTKLENPHVQPRPAPRKDPYPVPMNTTGGQPRETMQDKWDRAFARARDKMREAGERLEAKPPPRRLRAKYAQEVSPVRAWMESPEVSLMEKIYAITRQFYGKQVKREDFRVFGEGWQDLYARYKGWVSDDGLGWVDLNGKKTIVGWRYPEHELYKSDRMLERIARQNGFRFPGEGRAE
jgi:hypothetical protein